MSKILCSQHGKTFIAQVCQHIEDALNEGKSIDIVTIREELFDDDYWIYHYCQDCANKYGLKADTVYSGVNESITSLLRPICGECFQNWDQRPKQTCRDCLITEGGPGNLLPGLRSNKRKN